MDGGGEGTIKILLLSDTPTGICYDDQTEVLTRNGWRYFFETDMQDEFATIDTQGVIEYQKPEKMTVEPYDGKLYSLASDTVDAVVTPGHKLYVKRGACTHCTGSRWRRDFELVAAEDLIGKPKRFKKDGVWVGVCQEFFELPAVTVQSNSQLMFAPRLIPMDDWLSFLGHYIAEGSATYHQCYTVQVRQSRARHLDLMKVAMQKVTPFHAWNNEERVLVRDRQLFSYLKDNVGESHGKHDRRIPREFMELCPEQLRILWEAISLGDGSMNGKTEIIS
ncbi:MAG: hypothetical protein ACRD6W_01445, partial [Nitrososphaerales archaeon]